MRQCHYKYEVCSFALFGSADDIPIEHVGDLLGDIETQSNALGVDVFTSLQEAEHLEQLRLVLIFDADTCVLHLYFEILILGRGGCPDDCLQSWVLHRQVIY